MTRLEKLRNLGPVSAGWLAEMGIRSREDLLRIGSVEAYAMVRSHHADASLNLLWGLEAALQDIDWRELSDESKHRLREELSELLG